MSHEIPDDPSIAAPTLAQLKKSFNSGKTRPAEFRKTALKRLLEGYIALESEFNEAMRLDLGYN